MSGPWWVDEELKGKDAHFTNAHSDSTKIKKYQKLKT